MFKAQQWEYTGVSGCNGQVTAVGAIKKIGYLRLYPGFVAPDINRLLGKAAFVTKDLRVNPRSSFAIL